MMQSFNTDPFRFAGGPTGCLLVHGFSGSPHEMRGLGEVLAERGHTVLGVRLAGHGGTPEELHAARWQDWLASVEDAYDALRQVCPTVVVVGFSLGGALSLLLAQRHQFSGLVALSTPLALKGDWRLQLVPVAKYVVPWFYPLEYADFNDPAVRQQMLARAPEADFDDPEVQRHVRRSVKISLRAIHELQHVLHKAQAAVPRVSLPMLAMYGRDDEVIPLASADELITRIASQQKELRWWPSTGHQMLTEGPQRQAICAIVADFVQAIEAQVLQPN